MMLLKKILFILLLPVLAFAAEAGHFKGFVKISDSRELFVDWYQAKEGQPTVVLVNGLTYSTVQWDRFTAALVEKGVGVFRYDPMGMGETLLKYAPVVQDIAIEDQVQDLHALLSVFNLQKSVNLVGLSYGGGLALLYASTYPSEIKNLIAMSPYTEPVASQDQWIRSQIWYTRQVQPWNPATDDELYAYFFHQIVYSTFPSAEPVVLENPYKLEAVFHLGLGIRKFLAEKHVANLPANVLHLVIAGKDQYIPRDVLETYWSKVPGAAKASHIVVNNSEHKIPEAVPHFAASLVNEIISNRALFSKGQEFEADPYSGIVTYQNGSLVLPKEY